MTIQESFKRFFGCKSVSIGNLNRLATLHQEVPVTQPVRAEFVAGIKVTDEYRQICSLLEAGAPVVFVTGNAGTGKSTLIHYLRSVLKKKMAVVAPTGVAALNAGGVTIHSFFHLPPKIHEDADIKKVMDRQLYQKLELLIIDEVSMVRGDLMDSMDQFLRKNREETAPFAGVQLLLIGDLFQLPPVVPNQERGVLSAKGYQSPYFFSASCLQQSAMATVKLTEIFRQADTDFIALLNQVRIGEDTDAVAAAINGRCCRQDGFPVDITLTCTNSNADQINAQALDAIPNPEYVLRGEIQGHFSLEKDKLPSPLDLRLKAGARVMFTKNDEQQRWVNGTLGIIREISQTDIQVELVSDSQGAVYDVLPVTWETYKYEYDPKQDQIVARKAGEYRQFPLMLAWAVTIHKSQGKTLDNVRIDLGYGAFATGQAYVALSRCRVMDHIRLTRPIRPADIKCDPQIKRFYLALDELGQGE